MLSARVVRLLRDAGTDTSSAVRLVDSTDTGKVWFNDAPLALASRFRRVRHSTPGDGLDFTEQHVRVPPTIYRLLMRVVAVHPASWLWRSDVPAIANPAEGATRATAGSISLRMMLPILRWRARKPRVLLAALFRWV